MMQLLNPIKIGGIPVLPGSEELYKKSLLPAVGGFALARAGRTAANWIVNRSVTLQNAKQRLPGGMVGDVVQGLLTLLIAVPAAGYVSGDKRVAASLVAGALLSPMAGFISKAGETMNVDLGDYTQSDMGAQWSPMTAAYYPPSKSDFSGDYPTEIVGEPSEYNTAALGIWDDSGYPMGDEDDLMVSSYA